MEKIITRPATLNDLEILLRLEQGVIQAERPYYPTLKDEKINYYDIEELITAPDIELLVAESDRHIIGSGYARIEKAKPFLKHQQYAYMDFMYVLPEHQGKRVNKMIMEGLVQWSVVRGVTELRLEVYCENEGAIKAYEKAGFSKHLIEMRKGVEE